MIERPILFSGAMVKVILAGQKSQTRRIVKRLPPVREGLNPAQIRTCVYTGLWTFHDENGNCHGCEQGIPCPYGQPGDCLYVREDFYQRGSWEPVPNVRTKKGRQKWRFVPASDEILFEPPAEFRKGRHHKDPGTVAWHKRLGRFMRRVQSRIALEVTEIRVQRLGDISEEDAQAEGVTPFRYDPEGDCWTAAPPSEKYRTALNYLWGEINGWEGPKSWASNPWVWAISFRRLP